MVGVSVIIIGIGVQVFLYVQSYTHYAPAPDGTYSEGIVGTMATLNPLYASSAPEVAASRLMFSSLYAYDKTGHLSPDLAERVTISPDGTKYVITLRHNAMWQDGQPLTSRDIAFTIDTIKKPASRVNSALAANWRDVTVETPDDYTVSFSLPAYASFMNALTFPVVPQHILGSIDPAALATASFSTNPVGSGPFQFRLLQSIDDVNGEKAVHMVTNKRYYGQTPLLSRFEIHNYSSTDSAAKALASSAVTAMVSLDASQLKGNVPHGYTTDAYPLNSAVYLIMNTTQPTLKDVKVRQAIQRAIDTAMIRSVAQNNVTEQHLPYVDSQVPGSPSAPTFDAAAANQLLDEAGWAKGTNGIRTKDGKPLELQLKTVKNPQYERVATEIATELHAVGIDVKTTAVDDRNRSANFVQTVLQSRDYDLLLYELTLGADPDEYAYWHSSQTGANGYNFANYSSAKADAALISARDRLDADLRNAKYITFAKQWLADAPAVGLFRQSLTYTHTARSSAVDHDAVLVAASDRFMNVERWTVNQQNIYNTP